MSTEERKQLRADYVKQYIESAAVKGVKVTYSVDLLANKILFLSPRQIYEDLKKGRAAQDQEQTSSNRY